MMARRKTITPIPPIQWVKLRHIRLHLASGSTALRILAPVVVNPETVSKRASMKLGMSPFITKGRHPKALMAIQLRATIRKPSLA